MAANALTENINSGNRGTDVSSVQHDRDGQATKWHDRSVVMVLLDQQALFHLLEFTGLELIEIDSRAVVPGIPLE